MADRPPLLERLGVQFLERAAAATGAEAQADVHVLDPGERAALRRVETGAVLRAAIAGAVSATIAGLADTLAQPLLGADPELATAAQKASYWAVVAPAIIVASLGELSFLYWDALRSVDRMCKVAGLDLSPGSRHARRAQVATALVRAALELPNPPQPVLGIDPRRESSKLSLLAAGLLYKAKVSLTNFLFKALLRRLLGRSAVRAVLTFAAVPVSAAWDAIVSWRVVREARTRVLGPSAARELTGVIFDAGPKELSPAGRAMALRAVASSIVRTHDLHPNLEALLVEVHARAGDVPGETGLDDSATFLARLPALEAEERRLVLRVLALAVAIDGRLTRDERRLVREAQLAAGVPVDDAPVRRLGRELLAGDATLRESALA